MMVDTAYFVQSILPRAFIGSFKHFVDIYFSTERLALPTSDHGVAGSNPAGGEILPEPKRRFIAQSLSYSPLHRLELTEILLKGRKTLTHPSIYFSKYICISVCGGIKLVLLTAKFIFDSFSGDFNVKRFICRHKWTRPHPEISHFLSPELYGAFCNRQDIIGKKFYMSAAIVME